MRKKEKEEIKERGKKVIQQEPWPLLQRCSSPVVTQREKAGKQGIAHQTSLPTPHPTSLVLVPPTDGSLPD